MADPIDRPLSGGHGRTFTLGAAMIAVSGLAIILASVPQVRWVLAALPATLSTRPTGWLAAVVDAVGVVLTLWAQSLGAPLAVAVLVRSARTGLPPRPAEWLGPVVAFGVLDRLLLVFGPFNRALHALTGVVLDLGGLVLQLSLSAVAMLAVASCLVVLRGGGRVLPAWAKVLLLGALALAVLWGPLREGAVWLSSRLPTLGSLDAPWPARFFWGFAIGLLDRPESLLLSVAAVAAWRDLRRPGRPRRRWSEWAGATVAVLLALGLVASSLRAPLSAATVSAAGLDWLPGIPCWIALLALGRGLVIRYGTAWNQWLAPGAIDVGPA